MVHVVPFHLYRSWPCVLLLYVILFHLERQLANVCFLYTSSQIYSGQWGKWDHISGSRTQTRRQYRGWNLQHWCISGHESCSFHWTMHALLEHVSNHAAKEMQTQLILILANCNKIEFLYRVWIWLYHWAKMAFLTFCYTISACIAVFHRVRSYTIFSLRWLNRKIVAQNL